MRDIARMMDENEDKHLNREIKLLTSRTLITAQRILGYCEQTELIGLNTAQLLNNQDEKINKITSRLNIVDTELIDVEQNFKKLKRSNWRVLLETCCLCKFPKRGIINVSSSDLSDDGKLNKPSSFMSLNVGRIDNTLNVNAVKQVKSGASLLVNNRQEGQGRIKKLAKNSLDVLKYKLDDNIRMIDQRLDLLKSMTLQIGHKITSQNECINFANRFTDINLGRAVSSERLGQKCLSKI